MKKIVLAMAVMFFGITACNTNTLNNAETETSEEAHDHSAITTDTDVVPAVPENAKVFFANLNDGDTLGSPFLVEFGIEGMEVEPAGEVHTGKGHHHVIIDGSFIQTGGTVPADSVNIHYGGGQTSDSLSLGAGTHTLTMQFADGFHRSYGEQMSATISIVIE